MSKGEDLVQLSVRMPRETRTWIKVEAARLDMTVQEYILATVRRRLLRDQKREAKRAMSKERT